MTWLHLIFIVPRLELECGKVSDRLEQALVIEPVAHSSIAYSTASMLRQDYSVGSIQHAKPTAKLG